MDKQRVELLVVDMPFYKNIGAYLAFSVSSLQRWLDLCKVDWVLNQEHIDGVIWQLLVYLLAN